MITNDRNGSNMKHLLRLLKGLVVLGIIALTLSTFVFLVNQFPSAIFILVILGIAYILGGAIME